MSRRRARITWFEFGVALFAAALPIGVVLIVLSPIEFLQAIGAVIVGTGLVGLWISALGLQLEHPERWRALKASVVRIATGHAARSPVQR